MLMVAPYSDQDLNACVDAMLAAWLQGATGLNRQSRKCATESILNAWRTPGFRGMVARDDAKVLGLLFGFRRTTFQGVEFQIQEFIVVGEGRDRPVAPELLAALEEQLRGEGVDIITAVVHRLSGAYRQYTLTGFEDRADVGFLIRKLAD